MSMRPNILLMLSDQHRHDWGSYNPKLSGGLIRTPHLDWLANQGTRFSNCICASPLCGPSRACLASGVFYDRIQMIQHETDWDHANMDSFYRRLRDEGGYHVIGTGKFDLNKYSTTRDQPPGADGRSLLHEWGFSDGINNMGKWDGFAAGSSDNDPYYRFLDEMDLLETHRKDYEARRNQGRMLNYRHTDPTPLPDSAYNDTWVAGNACELIGAAPVDRPWFCQVNFGGPHEPLDITRSMDSERAGYPPPCVHSSDIDNHNQIRRNYSAMIENIDARIGDLIELLRKSGQLDNTCILYSSDHGEMLGDHNRWAKKAPYQPSIGVPLCVCGPGVRQGVVNTSPVSLIDLAATCLDWAGLPQAASMQSQSLLSVLQGQATRHREWVQSGIAGWWIVFDGRYKLICGYRLETTGNAHGSDPTAAPILFDLDTDPEETRNLAEALPEVVGDLLHKLAM